MSNTAVKALIFTLLVLFPPLSSSLQSFVGSNKLLSTSCFCLVLSHVICLKLMYMVIHQSHMLLSHFSFPSLLESQCPASQRTASMQFYLHRWAKTARRYLRAMWWPVRARWGRCAERTCWCTGNTSKTDICETRIIQTGSLLPVWMGSTISCWRCFVVINHVCYYKQMQNKMFYLKLMWGVFYGKGCKKTKITVHENSAWPLLELKVFFFFFYRSLFIFCDPQASFKIEILWMLNLSFKTVHTLNCITDWSSGVWKSRALTSQSL